MNVYNYFLSRAQHNYEILNSVTKINKIKKLRGGSEF